MADAEQDVECILLQMEFYRRCGVKDLSLQINSLGDAESKGRYRDALVAFLKPKSGSLSEDSQRRLGENPLRILDSKDPRDQEACKGARRRWNHFRIVAGRHFERVQELLRKVNVPFTVAANLVAVLIITPRRCGK